VSGADGTPRGRFIAFEGGEGCGKSTQARLLVEALRGHGLSVKTTREPGGTPGAEAIRQLLLAPPGEGWGARAEALLFAAARADHTSRLIRPALASGAWVVSDRFVDSSRAYQGWAGGLGDAAILSLHEFGSEGLRPDLVILLEVSDIVRAERLAARDGDDSDAIGARDMAYHAAVAERFRALAGETPDAFAIVDGEGTVGIVHDRVMRAMAPFLEETAA
jgi:dTMP kinase